MKPSKLHESSKNIVAWLIQNGHLVDARNQLIEICNDECNDAGVWLLFGEVNGQLGMYDEAIACLNHSLSIDSSNSIAYLRLGQVFTHQKLFRKAEQLYKAAIALDAQDCDAYLNLAYVLTCQGKVEEAIKIYYTSLMVRRANDKAHSNLVYVQNYLPNYSMDVISEEHRRWASCQTQGLLPLAEHNNSPEPERALRVGYLSPDFRRHSVAFFIEPLLEMHRSDQVITFCYANVKNPDLVTKRLHVKADFWRDISLMSDDEAVDQIRSDGIDILVDLAGHTVGNRLLLFARKPAPVQVTYLGYPVTTGLKTIDYRITDKWVDPPGEVEQWYTETLYWIENGHHCYKPPENSPDPVSSPEEINGFITFGTFNALPKINKTVISAWASILRCVPDSRLVVKNKSFNDPDTCKYFMSIFKDEGIDPGRIDLLGTVKYTADHLGIYGLLDIALDTFPYNGVTTTCEALWMGVPVITLSGMTTASRFGASLLSQVGLSGFIAHNVDSYIRLAVELSENYPLRSRLRGELRTQILNSTLCDQQVFVSKIEGAYRKMWKHWCQIYLSDHDLPSNT